MASMSVLLFKFVHCTADIALAPYNVMSFLQEFGTFWPSEHDDLECEFFRVRFTAEAQGGHYVLRDFTIQSRTVSAEKKNA